MGRKPLSPGRSIEEEDILFEYYRGLEVHEKVAIIMDLNRLADETALEGIRERHPGESEHRQKLRLAALKYGRDLMLKAYGWDPHAKGW